MSTHCYSPGQKRQTLTWSRDQEELLGSMYKKRRSCNIQGIGETKSSQSFDFSRFLFENLKKNTTLYNYIYKLIWWDHYADFDGHSCRQGINSQLTYCCHHSFSITKYSLDSEPLNILIPVILELRLCFLEFQILYCAKFKLKIAFSYTTKWPVCL